MEENFAAAVASWRDFYSTLAGAAATLVGLLFVALAFNPAVMRDEHPAGTRVWARQTFNSFLTVLVVSLIAMIPDINPSALGVSLSLLSVQGIWQIYRDFRITRQDPDPFWRSGATLWRFGSPAAAHIVLLWGAMLAFQANVAAMNWLFAAILVLLFAAVSNCWDLLKAIGEAPPRA